MNKRVIQITIFALLCAFTMQFLTGCYKSSDDERREREASEKEAKTEQPTEEAYDFMEAICGHILLPEPV